MIFNAWQRKYKNEAVRLTNECKARKVNCGFVYFVYILKPVLFGGFYKQ